jgi:hypothetical protein
MHEQLAEADDLVGGHPAIGAADPQIFRRSLTFEPRKKMAATIRSAQHGDRFQMIQHVHPVPKHRRWQDVTTHRSGAGETSGVLMLKNGSRCGR